ncbi:MULTISPECIES: cell division protein FtsQ/DivIB [unclassified Rhodococcus (in: high G+C Gram-positive bacteria)]|uniref:cell division protein FtsQ/DivIB n=1 Tax=unclassified Rhodococcus (in: high G+C Gram-positive bacteria) TaxID=192944 RepID=UPI0009F859FD|nr:FtsQ-type POTRA domain-containing protein [Rhodococcus sp. M8]QPG46419.1 FtsQ-type POTRA domain-containing protein [Rhodococcus sp. M8]
MTPASATRTRPRRAARPARRPSGRSVRVRTVLIGAAVVAAVLGLIAAAWLSPLLSVRNVEVVGVTAIPQDEVLARLELAEGTPLLQVDTAAAAQRVATLPRAASVRVQRVYPSTVRVTVTEREAVFFVDAPDGTHSLDADGVDFAVEPPPMLTPRLVTPGPGPGDPATAAAIEVLEALPPELRVQVGEVAAPSASEVSLTLHDGRIVVWGGVERSERKAQVVLPLLTQPGRTYDVAGPDLPTVR